MGVLNASAIKKQLNDWKLLPEPERLTELYFNNSSNLPTTYTPNQSQSFSFSVHNLEYRNMSYYYTISVGSGQSSSTPLQRGSFYLAQNHYKKIPVSLAMPDLGSRTKVIVSLTNPNESIDYWVTRASQ